MAQLLKENGQVSDSLEYLETAISVQEKIINLANRDERYELILNLKTLADFSGQAS